MEDRFKKGFHYFADNSDILTGNIDGSLYVDNVQEQIDLTIQAMRDTVTQRHNASDVTIRGFVAEDWHAGTFNAGVASKSGNIHKIFAKVRKDNDEVTDIEIHNGDHIVKIQSKYYKTSNDTAKELSNPKYTGVDKVAPSDQVHGDGANSTNAMSIADEAERQAHRNKDIRPEISDAYADTAANAKAVIESAGYSSKELSNNEAIQIVKDMKSGNFDPEKYGLVPKEFIHLEEILNKSLDAGIKAATMSLILKIGPQAVSLIFEMIKQGFIDKNDFKNLGFSALDTSAESFLRGGIAAGITASCKAGLLGKELMKVDPSIVGMLTAVTINAVKNAFDLRAGKITTIEYADQCARDIVVSSISFASGQLISKAFTSTFGVATQAIIPIPAIGFLIGSFVGSVVGTVVYEGSKKMVVSVLVSTGFTIFGIVKQDYVMPKEVYDRIGLDWAAIETAPLKTEALVSEPLEASNLRTCPLDQCDIVILKRGMIGVRTVGYC